MPPEPARPVVFLTFANASERAYLSQLKKESALLRDLFLPSHQKGEIELLREESLDSTELPKLLNQYKGRICIFHYGGHAGSNRLSLEDGEGNVNGLAELLSLQSGLKLAFLNGCSTQEQARPYLEAGVPVVLATTRSIADEEATFFAEHFYHALLNRHTIREAFRSASGALKTRTSAYQPGVEEIVSFRGFASRGKGLEEMPWRLYVQEDNAAAALNWSLTGQKEENNAEAAINKGKKTLQQRVWAGLAAAGVIVALLAGMAELTGYSLKDIFVGGPKSGSSGSLTVFVHSKEGRNIPILKGVGKVEITYGNKKAWESIDEKGKAVFNEIPQHFFEEDARVYINVRETDGEPYRALYPDSLYKLVMGQPVYLPVILGGLDKVFGTVVSGELPLEGVAVSIGLLRDTTNDMGYFELNIPDSLQKKQHIVNFYKAGYKMVTKTAYPQTGEPLQVIMAKVY